MLGVAVREVHSDVLKGEEELIFQVKREEWDGEFTDLCGPVTDRAVLLAVVAGPRVNNHCIRLAAIALTCTLLQSERLTSVALKALQKVKRPSSSAVLRDVNWRRATAPPPPPPPPPVISQRHVQ